MSNQKSDHATAGYQEWLRLTFLHWRISAQKLQQLIPPDLTIQEFDGSAWLGVIPFSMEGVRPWWSPAVPGVSWFLETNVRTYVVDRNGVPGVWFFSLDANKWLAVNIARKFWHLPYKLAKLTLQSETTSTSNSGSDSGSNRTVIYRGQRLEEPFAEYDISIEIGCQPAEPASPGTLSHFLVERYLLYAARPDGSLMKGQVHHDPYQLRTVNECSIRQTLTHAMGCPLPDSSLPDHVAFSDGVQVRVSPLN